MKKTALKLISLLLVLLTVFACLAACKRDGEEADGEEGGDGADGEVTTVETSKWETDENGFVKDTINRTLGGKEMRVLIDTSNRDDILPENSTLGENAIMDKVYTRNLELELRMECTFKVSTAPGEWVNMAEFVEVAEKAGDNQIDLICAFSLVPPTLAKRGLLSNLNNLEYPQIEMPWWAKSVSDWQSGGALYFVAGNSSNRVIRAQECVLVNADMIAADSSLTPVEELVLDNKWTVDKMVEYALTVNTDTSVPENEIVYGLVVDDHSRVDQFYYGAGLNMMRNNNGTVELAVFDQSHVEKTGKLVDKLGKIASTTGFFVDVNNKKNLMKSNQTMFMAAHMQALLNLDSTSAYFPVPAPMYDEEQGEYYTTPHNSYDVWCVPMTASNKEDSAILLEAIASSDYRTLAPYFYEEKLKMRYSDSADGMQIFDIIRNATNVDFGRIQSEPMGVMESPFRGCFSTTEAALYQNNYATKMNDTLKIKYETYLLEILTAYTKYKDR